MSDTADEDLRDVFKLLYDEDDWSSGDDEAYAKNPEAGPAEPEVEQVEVELEGTSTTERHLERYSRKRLIDGLNDLLNPNIKRQRVYSPKTVASSSSIPCTSSFPSLPPPSTYAPFSPLPLLSRLRTFEPATYSPSIPSPLDPVQAALHGWTNGARDTLSCGVCSARWELCGVAEIPEEKIRVEVARRMQAGLVNRHRKDCSWRVRRSPESLYGQLRRLLHPPTTSNIQSLAAGLERECVAKANSEFRRSSPLSITEISNLVTRIDTRLHSTAPANMEPIESSTSITHHVSSFAAVLAVFCWYPFHPNGPAHTLSDEAGSRRTDMVQCRLCERRIGLWAHRNSFGGRSGLEWTKGRTFDVLEEHLAWCPVRETIQGKGWWEDLALLKEKEKGDSAGTKGWITLSGKMEVKPWRRARIVEM
ncbi:C3HC zinc finger-like-domain-containing protein [Dioszegia hungarica]|uniref:C3HC zinc finger-like-domain-containing protein n=1 Tax=Dioszegia hungarica TaxID=4972 RepID=A0AA38LYP0_9TREE|nr:C3HC zinc finger-like-domain-containing protein [Dioszegia hungarica]KAI9639164.1 C3HC zinc finger-like-domain-containing protein [Dioszegia hungarica]